LEKSLKIFKILKKPKKAKMLTPGGGKEKSNPPFSP
jgi:hypothetical protein